MWFTFLGGGSLHNPALILFSTKATPKFINKIAPNMSTISKKEKEALGKNEITLSFEVWRKHTLKYVLVYLCLLKTISHNQDFASIHCWPYLLTEIKESFDFIDEDKDGLIQVEDIVRGIHILGLKPTSKEVDGIIADLNALGISLYNTQSHYCTHKPNTNSLNDVFFK